MKVKSGSIIESKLGRKIILDYIKQTLDEWRLIEIPPDKKNNYIRKIILTRNEEWKYYE